MIEKKYLGQEVSITDSSGRTWEGKVDGVIPKWDSDSGENELLIEFADSLTELKESEIKKIEVKGEI